MILFYHVKRFVKMKDHNKKAEMKIKNLQNTSSLFFLLFLLTIISVHLVIFYLFTTSTLITTPLGQVQGLVVTRFGHKIRCYLGLPYAKKPIGKLRFAKPMAVERWKGIYQATEMRPACLQKKYSQDKMNRTMEVLKLQPEWLAWSKFRTSEDCLYLNIFVPTTSNSNNKTVIVFLHGGGFREGSAQFYDGSELATYGDVVFVTINYRLGMFGFMFGGNEIPGNLGLHDQTMALKWVKDNIESFGGNPNNVVLMGSSAGAISAGYHLISNKSRQLFSRAILQSGSPLTPVALFSPEQQRLATINAIQMANCSDEFDHFEISSQTLECLRKVQPGKLMWIQQRILKQHRFAFMPVEDSDFLTRHPLQLIKRGKFSCQKEILIGTNVEEGAYFSAIGPLTKYYSKERLPDNFTKETVVKILEEIGPKDYKEYYPIVVNMAFEGVEDPSNSEQAWRRVVKIVGDVIFTCADYVFINKFSADTNRSVYYYLFNPKPSISPFRPKWAKGAVHGDEIGFVFGAPLVIGDYYTEKEARLSRKMMSFWTGFAKYGSPDIDNFWKRYENESPKFMNLDVEGVGMRNGFPGFKCDQYYEMFYAEAIKMVHGNVFKT